MQPDYVEVFVPQEGGFFYMPIRKVKGGYKIDNVPGVSKTKSEAKKRLAAIKIRKKGRKK